MTATRVVLDGAEAVHGHVRRICFKTGPPGPVGAELEWIVGRHDDVHAVVPLADLAALLEAAGPPPRGSAVTLEPGGQVELSSLPAPDLSTCLADLSADLEHLRRSLAGPGLTLLPTATDPWRPPLCQVRHPRYDAMAEYFARLPHDLGAVMMTSTASVQVNLEAGQDTADQVRRWRLLHLLGPVLVAAFANSPRQGGRLTGWKSTRQAVWLGLDPVRTHAPRGDDPAASWADYALAAPVMMVRRERQGWWPAPGFTFGEWVEGRVPGMRAPTEDDLAYHLTTLFPPVRPRGWFEVRYVDAQDPQWWPVPVAVLCALLDLPGSDVVEDACLPVADAWERAGRLGPADPELRRAAVAVFTEAVDRLAAHDQPAAALVADFTDTYVARGCCPADGREPSPSRTRESAYVPLTPIEEAR